MSFQQDSIEKQFCLIYEIEKNIFLKKLCFLTFQRSMPAACPMSQYGTLFLGGP